MDYEAFESFVKSGRSSGRKIARFIDDFGMAQKYSAGWLASVWLYQYGNMKHQIVALGIWPTAKKALQVAFEWWEEKREYGIEAGFIHPAP